MQSSVTTFANITPALHRSLFADRERQFVARHRWNLCVTPEGLEIDQYDDAHSAYVVVEQAGRHLGSCRVRPMDAATMLAEHFSDLFPRAMGFVTSQPGTLYELTRFCRSPDLSVADSRMMLEALAVELDRFRDARNITGFVAVVFPEVARFLGTIGVRHLKLDEARLDGRKVQLICITHAVDVRAPVAPPQTARIAEMVAA